MGINSRVMNKAIKEHMRTGRIPDLQRLQREDREEQEMGKLSCNWDRDRSGKLCYSVFLYSQLHRNQIRVHSFPNIARNEVNRVNNLIQNYNRTHRNFLMTVSRNPNTTNLKNLQKELDTLVNAIER